MIRGNDVIQGTPDILVTDSLTGSVPIKMLSAYTSGGSFETTGYGYDPGIGKGYEKLIKVKDTIEKCEKDLNWEELVD